MADLLDNNQLKIECQICHKFFEEITYSFEKA